MYNEWACSDLILKPHTLYSWRGEHQEVMSEEAMRRACSSVLK